MDLLFKLWGQLILVLMGLTITTLDLLGMPTQALWLEILPTYRDMFGLGGIDGFSRLC